MRYRLLIAVLFILPVQLTHGEEVTFIYLIRHAEQALDVEDPPLTERGEMRAKAWGTMLDQYGINAVYTSKKRRTIQTGEHIAKALNIPIMSIPRKEVTRLVNEIRTQHAGDKVLVVTHKRQMPKIFKELGLPTDISENLTFSRDEYHKLFTVVVTETFPAAFETDLEFPLEEIYIIDGLAIGGYDPVAYFTMDKAVKGSDEFTYEWKNATWHFANAEHRDLFASDPAKYTPYRGGYCAHPIQIRHGSSPQAWEIKDEKLYLYTSN